MAATSNFERDFQLLVESVKDYAIFMLDPGGHIMSWNLGAQRIKGYSADEVIGQHFSIFFQESDRADGKPQRLLAQAARDGRVEDEAWRVRKDGTAFWANVVITALLNPQGKLVGYGKVTRDLTERKRAEEARIALEHEQAQRNEAENLLRQRDAFLSVAAHELKTPLTALKGYVQLLGRQLRKPSSADQLKLTVDRVVHEITRLQTLMDDLLDVTRIQQGVLPLHLEHVDLADIADVMIGQISAGLAPEDHRVITLDAPEPVIGTWDPLRVEQVLWNLISNAVKYSPLGSPVEVKVETQGNEAVLIVHDAGGGIDPAIAEQVFEPFARGEGILSPAGGTGLGLYITKRIVERHGGTLEVQNTSKKGTTFKACIPLEPPVIAGESAHAPAP